MIEDVVEDEVNPNLLPLPASGPGSLDSWRNQIILAEANMQAIASDRKWDENQQSYLGKKSSTKYGKNTANVRKDFALAEIKKALLFYQLPDVAATAKKPEYEPAAPLVGAVVNDFLSPERVDAMSMIDEVLADLLVPAGIGVSKIGYEAFVDPKLPEQPQPNPLNPALPAMDELGAPIMAPNIVRESYFWTRIPPKMFRFPAPFTGSNFDKASWNGFKFTGSKVAAKRTFNLTDEQLQSSGLDVNKDLLASDVSRSAAQTDNENTVTLHEIWYRASDVDPDIGDPEIIRQLVILDGKEDAPIIHRDSPYQVIENGRMVSGMRGFPFQVFSLRYASDQAIPPSDCSASREQIDELSKGRTQMIDQRDRAVPLTLIDLTRLPKETQDKILAGEVQEIIPVNGMDSSNPPAFGLQRAQWPRENFEFNNIINRDIGETWSLGQNQMGLDTDTKRTATELSLMQGGTDTRMDKERARFLRQFAIGCQKLLALIQMFATDEDYARVSDESGKMLLQAWDATAIAGEYTITLAPDSSQRVDAMAEKKRAIDIFQMFGNDPLTNQVELRKMTWRKLGMDANRLVLEPKPKPPEKPQVSVALKGEDLNPMMPQYINVATMLAATGIGMAPPDPNAAPPEMDPATNPGGVPPVTPLDKRFDTSGDSGQLPGGGQAPDVAQVGGR
jgi:hypothetical protein